MENGTKISNVQTIPTISQELKDLRCCDGDSVTLECKVSGAPPFDIRWEKDGKLIHLGEDFNADFDGEVAKLSIMKVFPEDEGEYTCVAYNDLGKVFTSACLLVDIPEEKETLLKQQLKRPSNLTVGSTPRSTPNRSVSPRPLSRIYPSRSTERVHRIRAAAPKFYAIPHNRVAEEGETVRFQCAVAGHPDPWVTWDKDGSILTSSTRMTITESDDLRILEIRDVTPQDSGIYKVILENDYGRVEASARLEVISHRPAYARGLRARSLSPKPAPTYSSPWSSSVRYGSTARLFYDITSVPTPFLKWYKDGVPLEDSPRYVTSHDDEVACLMIKDVTFNDEGSYSCDNGRSVELKIIQEDLAPRIIKNIPKMLTTIEGESVKLQMEVTGRQPFDVVWMKDGCVLPDCDELRQTSDDGVITLTVSDVFVQDSGWYTCEVYNLFGEASDKCQVVVHENCLPTPSLDFVKYPSPVISVPGKTVSFCVRVRNADGERPKISWEVAGVPATVCSRFQVEEDGDVNILHITGVTHLDAGEVKCTATKQSKSASSTESISCSTQLTVVPDLDTFDEGCSAGGGASMEAAAAALDQVTGGGSGAGVMVVSEINEPAMLLKKPQDTTAFVGDRVLLKATYMGHPEPAVRWTKAGKELKNDERTSITSGDGVSCLLLQNITADDSGKYDICVENCYGADCNYSSVSVEGPPDPPSGKPCVSANLDSVTVAWSSSPYDGGKIVTGFSVEYSLAGSDVWTTATDDCHSLSYTLAGLQPGARYVFRVRAQNVHGYSKPSQESDTLLLEEKNESSFEPRIVTLEPGPEFKNRFEVLEELGKGRFGVVHKVVEKTTSQKLAAKFIKCRTSKDRDKVQDEIDIMNLLRHQKLLQLAAAFENPKDMIMVTEYISGGELFERVVADDFTLTEKDCILFMRQICEGVAYMHSQNVVHLDLKPENIMCHTRTSHEIKIIDFGLAQKLNPDKPIRVLFGTPEFIPPEIINYEPIGVESDMWSLGVICYVLLSGLSPFMGDNDAETFANITRADYDFEDEAFNTVSQNARDFIAALLLKRKDDRLSAEQCLKHIWLDPESHKSTVVLSTDKLKKFIIRRKWQKTGNAIRALGRMATLSASRRNSANSNPGTPRASITGGNPVVSPRMTSLNEEDANCAETKSLPEEVLCNDNDNNTTDNKKIIRRRACSERSDSGISDCSTHLTSNSCTSTPLLGKKFPINEEPELCKKTEMETSPKFVSNTSIILSNTPKQRRDSGDDSKKNNGVKLESKIDTLTKKATSKCKSPSSTGSLKRIPIYSSSSVAKAIKKFDNQIEKTPKSVVIKHTPSLEKTLQVNNKLNKITSSPAQEKKSSNKSKIEKIIEKIDNTTTNNNNNNNNLKPVSSSVKIKCPSPSLMRKTQSVLAKEQSNEYYMSKCKKSNDQTKSPIVNRKDKPKSASFQKAAAFWNSPKR